MSQNWTALLSLIVVLHITPKRHKWRYSHTKAPPPVLERRNEGSPKCIYQILERKLKYDFIISTNLKTNFSIAKSLSWNQWFYILSLFFFINFNHYWIKCIWVVLQTTLHPFLFLVLFIHEYRNAFQNHKLSVYQMVKITN